MGEVTAYFVPRDQAAWFDRAEEIADRFWDKGVFLSSPDGHIDQKIRRIRERGEELPARTHQFTYESMGIDDAGFFVPVPHNVYDASCPKCRAEVYEEFTNSLLSGGEGDLRDRPVSCSSCGHTFRAADTVASDPGFEFARVYIWVSDIYDGDWEPSFRETVESILGPCKEILAWDT